MKERRKRLVGNVVSDKMDKTVVVEVERLARHPLYKKVLRLKKKHKAHDEENACRVGDRVRIVESRPLSREKRWRVEEIVKRAAVSRGGPSVVGRPSPPHGRHHTESER